MTVLNFFFINNIKDNRSQWLSLLTNFYKHFCSLCYILLQLLYFYAINILPGLVETGPFCSWSVKSRTSWPWVRPWPCKTCINCDRVTSDGSDLSKILIRILCWFPANQSSTTMEIRAGYFLCHPWCWEHVMGYSYIF